MKIIVVGGDGFCGWPVTLNLKNKGYDVLILDNLSRRKIDQELNTNSLTRISPIEKRISVSSDIFGNIGFVKCNTSSDVELLRKTIFDYKPSAIIMFGEQRAAPYSMIDDKSRRYTVDNNIISTHNICSAVADIDSNIHLIHLGTMGVYGYSDLFGQIPEGYLDITVDATNKKTDILYPANPGSIYHLTKCLDQLIFQYYTKNWNLKITDLHQGIVWGINTQETSMHPALINRFDYDGIYGTVLNRFLVQSAAGKNLTVYGTGGQKRAFIHISDTVNCIRMALESVNSVKNNKVRIMNQVTEVYSVLELAKLVSKITGCKISYLDNPRNELAENDLFVSNDAFLSLGLNPITLSEKLFEDIRYLAEENLSYFKDEVVLNSPKWN